MSPVQKLARTIPPWADEVSQDRCTMGAVRDMQFDKEQNKGELEIKFTMLRCVEAAHQRIAGQPRCPFHARMP